MKRFTAFLLVVLMLLSVTGCGNAAPAASPDSSSSESVSIAPATEEGKVLRIFCWNDEFQRRLKEFYPKYNDETKTIGDIKVEWVITPNENNAYQNSLDEALLGQGSASADQKVDLFLIEADYALKYTDADAGVAMDVKKVGLTDADMSQMYQYTKDVVTGSDGIQRGVSWQGCPGVFIYRRSIANAVLGTDDPVKVQEALSDWSKFDATAEKMAGKGYKMLAGYDDSYRTFSNNVTSKWVNDKNEITIDSNIQKWIEQTKSYTDKKYNNPYILWDPNWASQMGPKGNSFGYFGPAWFIDFVMTGNSLAKSVADGGKQEVGNGTFGDWAACAGPQGYFWGGTWMCAAEGTDNTATILDIMKVMACSEETATALTKSVNEFANNMKAMQAIAASDYGSAFLGGQNVIGAMDASAKNIDMSKASAYDQGLNEGLQTAMHDYFNGKVDFEKALQNFYDAAIVKYPELKKPA